MYLCKVEEIDRSMKILQVEGYKMANLFKRIIRLCAILWGLCIVIVLVSECAKCISGGYVEVDATVVLVRHYKNRSTGGGYYNRANGYVNWEYNGEMIFGDRLVDLPVDAQEGDIKRIWVDAKTGEYSIMQGIWSTLIGCLIHILFCVLILKYVKVNKTVKQSKE